jgi:hypothetical protein
MCLLVFIASDCPLPTIVWRPKCPHFHVTELIDRDEPVKQHFSKPFAYYAGSHEGCGCGLQYGEYEGIEEDADSLAAAKESRQNLADYLTVALQHQQTLEVFACWDGDQNAPPEYRDYARPTDLIRHRTFFRERELLVISSEEPVA